MIEGIGGRNLLVGGCRVDFEDRDQRLSPGDNGIRQICPVAACFFQGTSLVCDLWKAVRLAAPFEAMSFASDHLYLVFDDGSLEDFDRTEHCLTIPLNQFLKSRFWTFIVDTQDSAPFQPESGPNQREMGLNFFFGAMWHFTCISFAINRIFHGRGFKMKHIRSKLVRSLWVIMILVSFTLSACTTYQPSATEGQWTNSTGEVVSESVSSVEVSRPRISSREATIPKPYRLRSGDTLDLLISHLTPVNEKGMRLTEEGFVDLPFVGMTKIVGKTLVEAKQQLSEIYANVFTNAQVTLHLVNRHPPACYVLGQVGSPGMHEISGGASLVEVISRAGGFTYLDRRDALGASDIGRSFVARAEGLVAVDFESLFNKGDLSENIPIMDGDMVFVPDSSHKEVVVLGSVNAPGVIPMSTGRLNVISAIANAGGFSKFADMGTVAVVRNISSNPIVTMVNTEKVLDALAPSLALQSGDVIFVAQDDLRALDLPSILKTASSGLIVAMGASAAIGN
ncbi:MAG: polysaccharide export outer membrane protein [Planctomycetota bacterium]